MSTFFPAGGPYQNTGNWWKLLHSSIEAGADLNALRLVHAVGISHVNEDTCTAMENQLHANAACLCYDQASILVIEPGVTDEEVISAAENALNVSREQLHLWRVIEALEDGLQFEPIDPKDYTSEGQDYTSDVLPHDIVLTDAEFSYFPLWNVKEGEVFCYVCENVWDLGDGTCVSEEALETFFAKKRHVLALDREALHKAVVQAQDFLNSYVFTNLLTPVHYSTMTTPELAESYLKSCNECVWPVFDNLYFEITKVPADIDRQELNSAIQALAPYGQGVLVRVDNDFVNFSALSNQTIVSVGLDFHYDMRSDENIQEELANFATAASDINVPCHAHSIGSMENCITAVRAGYSLISSTAVAPPLDAANPQEDFVSPPDILRNILRSVL